jgi:ATP-binding cassette subfamily D (ALD) long-chain fatty acid import protein
MLTYAALITISTRASLKKYHTYHLILTEGSSSEQDSNGSGSGNGGVRWELQRVGTETEKMHARRELEELREKLAQVERWKARHAEIERELGKVWVERGEEPMPLPAYVEAEEGERKGDGEGHHHETEAEETQDEADYQEAQEEMGEETETETEGETLVTAEGQGDEGSAAGEGSGVVV